MTGPDWRVTLDCGDSHLDPLYDHQRWCTATMVSELSIDVVIILLALDSRTLIRTTKLS